jgi:2-polyprenyl-6-methoxyphenol hydroxylase-like FAD-dependent oxidoreductase
MSQVIGCRFRETLVKALVVGAGIAGLATALRLGRDGWDVEVLERSPVLRSSGYIMNVMGPGFTAVETMDLVTKLRPKSLGSFASHLVDQDGATRVMMPASFAESARGERALSLFRGGLEETLYEAASEVADIRFGVGVSAVESSEEGARATLTDGSSATVDLLVGADGLDSTVRNLAFGDGYGVDRPYVLAACRLPESPASVPTDSSATFIDIGRTVGVINLGDDGSCAFFSYRCEDPGAELSRGVAPSLRVHFSDVGGSTPEVLGQIERSPETTYFDRVSQVVMPRWSDGTTVLVGDAAWCTSLFAGYGGSLALHGAQSLGDNLAGCVAPSEIPARLAEWEEGLRPRVEKRQKEAARGERYFSPTSRAAIRMNELTVRAMLLPGVRGIMQRAIRNRKF